LKGLLIGFNGKGFIFLGLVALSADEAFTAFHLVVYESVVEMKL
jgi:hypothetical protein